MKILCIPHIPIENNLSWEGSRYFHLLSNLSTRHEISCITWSKEISPAALPRYGRYATSEHSFGKQFKIVLGPAIPSLWKGYPSSIRLMVNQRLFQKAIREIWEQIQPDVALYASSHHFTGYPFFPNAKKVIFDYLDLSPQHVEKTYMQYSNFVVGVSPSLCRRADAYDKKNRLIPNGIRLSRYSPQKKETAKKKLGLCNSIVISLIGLTCSDRLYFVDALQLVRKKIPQVTFMIVGGGKMKGKIDTQCEVAGLHNFLSVGHVLHEDAADYFHASDVGLYPGEDVPYYRESCPIKILEYSAAGAQVVSSPVDMFMEGWPNIRISKPTAQDMAERILNAIANPKPSPSLDQYDWNYLSTMFEETFF